MGQSTESAILFRLGVLRGDFNNDLRVAAGEVRTAGTQMVQGFAGPEHAQDRLFTSSHRAAGQLRLLSAELASGASAGQIFVSVIERAERVLRLPLGSLAFLVGLGLLIKSLHDVSESDDKMKRALGTSLKPSGVDDYKASIETLQERIKETIAQAGEMQRRLSAPTFSEGLSDLFRNVFSLGGGGSPRGVRGNVFPEQQKTTPFPTDIARDETNAKIREAQAVNERRIAETIQRIKERGVEVEERIYQTKLAAAEAEKEAANKLKRPDLTFEAQTKIDSLRAEHERAQLTAEQEKTLQALLRKAQEVNETIREKSRASLADLAAGGDQSRSPGGVALGVGAKARDAQAEEELAQRAALRGRAGEAERHQTRAEEIKSGIGTLKDSDKILNDAVKSGLDASDKINRIEQNTRRNIYAY